MTSASTVWQRKTELTPADFAYELPPELVAQEPLARRDESRLLVLDRKSGAINHAKIKNLGEWLTPGDLLVANNTRVIPARLRGFRPSGGAVEVLLLRPEGGIWSALARPAKRLKAGSQIEFPSRTLDCPAAVAYVEENLGEGHVRLRFVDGADEHLEAIGETPLPPYIHQPLSDPSRYQTIYGRVPGSAAAPTAGLHFTPELIEQLREAGIGWAEITLHVGLDTFRPVTAERIQDHQIHQEWCEVPDTVAQAIAACRERGGRVIAVGTTVARTLETLGRSWRDDAPRGYAGFTDLFIVPGHEWRIVDALLTNFHLPRSSLLMLVSALANRESVLAAYEEAVHHKYRFYSFGDAMLVK